MVASWQPVWSEGSWKRRHGIRSLVLLFIRLRISWGIGREQGRWCGTKNVLPQELQSGGRSLQEAKQEEGGVSSLHFPRTFSLFHIIFIINYLSLLIYDQLGEISSLKKKWHFKESLACLTPYVYTTFCSLTDYNHKDIISNNSGFYIEQEQYLYGCSCCLNLSEI